VCGRHLGASMGTLLRMRAWDDSHNIRQRGEELDLTRYEPVRAIGAWGEHDADQRLGIVHLLMDSAIE
jgi:hypothetical protein